MTDPDSVDTAAIAALVANGSRPILQFSKPGFSDGTLETVNALCERFGDALDVRFFGFYGDVFDCRVLRRLPAVSSLLVDCLHEASHVDEVVRLTKLRRLSLGIDLFDADAILAAPGLRGLRELSVGPTKTRRIDLTPVAQMTELASLDVDAQDTSLEAVGQCAALKRLRLRSIRREISVSFVNRIAGLESLTMILGGREDIDEIGHDGLRELEIVRVRGLKRIEPERFGRLERLLVEDQIQLRGLRFERSPSLSDLRIINCKTFDRLEGLARLGGLDELRVSRTDLDLEKLIEAGLPPRLRVFAFYTGKVRENARARKRLDELGYIEFEKGSGVAS